MKVVQEQTEPLNILVGRNARKVYTRFSLIPVKLVQEYHLALHGLGMIGGISASFCFGW